MKRLMVDYDKCTGCEMCAMRCSLEKTGAVNPSQARIHLVRHEEEGIMMPAVCRHCHNPKCLPACPVSAIVKDAVTGLVSINADTCIGCKKCLEACTYDSPRDVSRQDRTGKQSARVKVICDLCGGSPACAEMCQTGALSYAEVDPLGREKRHADLKKLTDLVKHRREAFAARPQA